MAKTHGICGGGQDEGPGTGAEAARSETVGVAWEGGRRGSLRAGNGKKTRIEE